MGSAGVALARALAAAAWRSRAATSSFLSFDCSAPVMAGFLGLGGRSPTAGDPVVCGGAGTSARASIGDEPAVEVAHPPSERPDSSSAAAANGVVLPSFDINTQHALGDSHSVPPALRANCDQEPAGGRQTE